MQVNSRALEAKVLGEKVIDRPRVVFSKWIKIKSRRSDNLSYCTKIRNKSGFYSEEDT